MARHAFGDNGVSATQAEKPATAQGEPASELDQRDGTVGSTHTPFLITSQPICAELVGSGICRAAGLTARSAAPVLAICRALIAAGHDPDTPLEARRAHVLALQIRSIGEGAQLAVEDDRHGRPRFRRWRDRGCGAGPLIAQFEGTCTSGPQQAGGQS